MPAISFFKENQNNQQGYSDVVHPSLTTTKRPIFVCQQRTQRQITESRSFQDDYLNETYLPSPIMKAALNKVFSYNKTSSLPTPFLTMNKLEASGALHGQPETSMEFGQPPDLVGTEVLPFRLSPDELPFHRESLNRSLVDFVDQELVVKIQKQYSVPPSSIGTGNDLFLLNLGLGNFEAMVLERQTFKDLQNLPHINLVTGVMLEDVDNVLLFEHVKPLRSEWAAADIPRRYRWAIELASAVSHLEAVGIVPVKTCVDDIGVDSTGRLKLMGFGTSPRCCPRVGLQQKSGKQVPRRQKINYDDMKTAYQRLAACLHYILTGIDLDEQAQKTDDDENTQIQGLEFRETVWYGEFPISPEASPISSILKDSWAPGAGAQTLEAVEEKVRRALGSTAEVIDNSKRLSEVAEVRAEIERKGREWLATVIPEPRWLDHSQYEEKFEQALTTCNQW